MTHHEHARVKTGPMSSRPRIQTETRESGAVYYAPVEVPWSELDRITLDGIHAWMTRHGWARVDEGKWRRWWHRPEDNDTTVKAPPVLASEVGTARAAEVQSFYSDIARNVTASFVGQLADWHHLDVRDVVHGLVGHVDAAIR